jgi:hypothetical protein
MRDRKKGPFSLVERNRMVFPIDVGRPGDNVLIVDSAPLSVEKTSMVDEC